LVYRYTVRPAEFVSQIPKRPLAVFKANAVPEAAELGAAEAVMVVGGLVVVVLPAADVPEELLQAAANIATAASGRPKPSVRSEVLRSMKILPCRCGPIADPRVMRHLFDTQEVPERFDRALETRITRGAGGRTRWVHGRIARVLGYRGGDSGPGPAGVAEAGCGCLGEQHVAGQ
jgi:hypothetical protein